MAIAHNSKREELLHKAELLPCRPGVYIMKDENGRIIYVGKSKKLASRVSQYFQNGEKNLKTARMVSLVRDFDYMLCDTEIEALALENTLIKKHTPKYNIKLKDAKSYPYIKMTDEEYPRFLFTRSRNDDKGRYFGPYTGSGVASSLLTIVHKTLGIPSCTRHFPEDIGKGRPCIYYEMKKCCGLCTGNVSKEEYLELCSYAARMLRGNIKDVSSRLEEKMMKYAEEENFESAITMRDAIGALRRLEVNQKVVADPNENLDCIGIARGERLFGISVFIVRNGSLTDKREFIFGADGIADDSGIISFLTTLYRPGDYIPPLVLLSAENDDSELLAEYLSKCACHKVEVRVPQRGKRHKLSSMVVDNIKEKIEEAERKSYSAEELLCSLAALLSLPAIPDRIEAWDISNLSYENITAGMIVISEAEFKKKDYRIFGIKGVSGAPDDYASMAEALRRRFAHATDESGSFSEMPDLILLDGGKGHVSTVKSLLSELGLDIPAFGMVKDDSHRTRALCTDEYEIDISETRQIFNFIYKIQEEVHRFTVSRMMGAKQRTLKSSILCEIKGIGKVKARILLDTFGSVKEISEASLSELMNAEGLSKKNAESVYKYFH